jgi:hypothetical protein
LLKKGGIIGGTYGWLTLVRFSNTTHTQTFVVGGGMLFNPIIVLSLYQIPSIRTQPGIPDPLGPASLEEVGEKNKNKITFWL